MASICGRILLSHADRGRFQCARPGGKEGDEPWGEDGTSGIGIGQRWGVRGDVGGKWCLSLGPHAATAQTVIIVVYTCRTFLRANRAEGGNNSRGRRVGTECGVRTVCISLYHALGPATSDLPENARNNKLDKAESNVA